MSAELAERHALAGWVREFGCSRYRRRCTAIRFLVAHGQVVALLAVRIWRDRLAADRGFNRVLNIADVDSEAVGLGAIDDEIHIWLAATWKSAEVGDAGNSAHHVLHLVGLGFERFSGRAEQFDGQFAFDAADRFFDVVGDGLRKIPVDAGDLSPVRLSMAAMSSSLSPWNSDAIARAAADRRRIPCCRSRWRRCRRRGGRPG